MDDKKFVVPEAEIQIFVSEDIITLSGNEEAEWYDGTVENW